MKSFNRIRFLLVVAVAAIFDGICGRKLAINAAAAPLVEAPESVPAEGLVDPQTRQVLPGAVVTVGLPKDLDVEKVRQRKIALMRAGTEALLAEKLAIDAETQQLQRDKHLTADVHMEEVPVTAKVPVVDLKPDPKAKK